VEVPATDYLSGLQGVSGVTVRVEVSPTMLRWAVSRAGWDHDTAVGRIPQFDDWVEQRVLPTLKQLEEFAKKTYTPFGHLFLAEPPNERIPIPDMRTLGDTEVERPSANLLDIIYLCQDRQEWYRSYLVDNGAAGLGVVGSATMNEEPYEVAERIRKLLQLDEESPLGNLSLQDSRRTLIDRIEELGVLVMVSGIVGSNTRRVLDPQEFRGFALVDAMAPLIFVNAADTLGAQVFTLVHELSHVLLGESALSDTSGVMLTEKREEKWCNRVAAEVLVPASSLAARYQGDASPERLERLARFYSTSTLVVLNRLYDAGLLGWDEFRGKYSQERERIMVLLEGKSSKSTGGNYYNTAPMRLGRQFARAILSSTLEGATSYREAYELLGVRGNKAFQGLAEKLGVA